MGFTLTHTFYIGSRLQNKFQNFISKLELKINMFLEISFRNSKFWKNNIWKNKFLSKEFLSKCFNLLE